MGLQAVLVRGGGDLASGAALRLHRAGFPVLVTEIAEPLAVRRTVSFAEAVYEGRVEIEGVGGVRVESAAQAAGLMRDAIPVLVDPDLEILSDLNAALEFPAIVDARLLKRGVPGIPWRVVVGLGPGFVPGENCAAVVETMRGHTLGRVYRDRAAAADTGRPEGDPRRVLRAPAAGVIRPAVGIGDLVQAGQVVGAVVGEDGEERAIATALGGVVRGMIRPGIRVAAGVKIGDVDPRGDPALCRLVSDKALAVGGGVLEALMSVPELRRLAAGV